jgi:hypothetical protein
VGGWGGRGAGWTISGRRHFRITGNKGEGLGVGVRVGDEVFGGVAFG